MATENTEVKFGKACLKAETPKPLKWIYRGAGLALTLWLLVISNFAAEIPVGIQLGVVKILGFLSVATYTVIQFFGYAKTDKDNGETTT